MSAIILDGKSLNIEIKENLKEKISKLAFQPKLAIIQIGENKESTIYIEKKKKFGQQIPSLKVKSRK